MVLNKWYQTWLAEAIDLDKKRDLIKMNSQQLPFDKLRRALSKHLLEENYELLQVHHSK